MLQAVGVETRSISWNAVLTDVLEGHDESYLMKAKSKKFFHKIARGKRRWKRFRQFFTYNDFSTESIEEEINPCGWLIRPLQTLWEKLKFSFWSQTESRLILQNWKRKWDCYSYKKAVKASHSFPTRLFCLCVVYTSRTYLRSTAKNCSGCFIEW